MPFVLVSLHLVHRRKSFLICAEIFCGKINEVQDYEVRSVLMR